MGTVWKPFHSNMHSSLSLEPFFSILPPSCLCPSPTYCSRTPTALETLENLGRGLQRIKA
uniref:Uncharacterized protein n=1 Tax=Octopus bimaculoides TaxID=37653 RepID=A0A0L8HRP8_OCTBM